MDGGIYLLLGSNMGDKHYNLRKAREHFTPRRASSVYVTGAWGKADQPDFLNQVIEIDLEVGPEELLQEVLQTEKKLGRVRLEKWGERVIDIDILFYGDKIINRDNLIVPHPEIQNRRFALTPLAEIAPSLIHPLLKKTISQLLEECKDPLPVTRLQR